jgi:amino acid adenylation domain-containing protein
VFRRQLLSLAVAVTSTDPPAPLPDVLVDWERAVAAHAGRPAVRDRARSLTYAQADALANACAARLRAAGAGPERLVGLRFAEPAEYVLGILSTLKAGAGFVIHESGTAPGESPAHLWLGETSAPPEGARPGVPAVALRAAARAEDRPGGRGAPAHPAQLAYVLFTSGSTGRPKGAMVERGNLSAFCAAVRERLALGPRDRWFQLAAPSFDVFLEETLPVLTAGGTLLCRAGGEPSDFAAVHGAMEAEGATVVEMSTQYWLEYARWLAAAGACPPPGLRALIVGGERMDARAYRAWQARLATPLVHVYGITETTCTSTMYHGRPGPEDDDVPVGTPLSNTVLRPGAGGGGDEIGLAGACVGRGYLDAPGLTADRFRPDPAGPPGSRLYATGDYGYVDADGALVFRARRDDQVKVRGHRVRLSAVEAALQSLDGVLRAVVLPDPRRVSGLVAFVVRGGGDGAPPRPVLGPERAALRAALEGVLPAWAVPGRFFSLDALPRSVNGKVDREALRRSAGAGEGGGGAGDRPAASHGAEPLVARVTAAFRAVLQAPDMQPDDDFFDFGGDSLLALALAWELGAVAGTGVSAAALFDAPTPRAMAQRLARQRASAGAAA